jgi:dTMP kinase
MPMANCTAVFITFEGIEAAGKSTLIAALNDDLRARGENVLVTREPGGTPLGLRIRQIWDDPASAIDPLAEALLMSADRAQHVAAVIVPALRAGVTILCDRYFDATIAYQGFGRGLDIEMLLELSLLATSRVTPNLTILVDIPPELSLARVRARGDADRMDREDLDFHARVRTGYQELVKRYPQRFAVIDGTQPPAGVLAQALEIIAARRPAVR